MLCSRLERLERVTERRYIAEPISTNQRDEVRRQIVIRGIHAGL